jgi:His Kinase A (phospho-acceptor) domain
MRYDDRLATILAVPAPDARAKSIIWAQLVDLLAQDRGRLSGDARGEILSQLQEWRSEVPLHRRYLAAESISGRSVPRELVAFFGADSPQVAAAILPTTKLDADAWNTVIPALPQASRALLRERRDLPTETVRALAAFGHDDFALPISDDPASVPISAASPQKTEIRDLVARIEAFQRDREIGKPAAKPIDTPELAAEFRFETDIQGLLCWVEGVPRGALIGLSIAEMADPGACGVDGHAAGAFRQRSLFRDARLVAPGEGDASGEWLISADPLFSPNEGRFLGYRGVARRPRRSENLNVGEGALLGPGLAPDSVRQLVHELRTPLNAIRGFAEMINEQMLGPVAQSYRSRAYDIVREASRLLGVFDDLDSAARLERGHYPRDELANTNLVQVLDRLADDFRPLSNERDVLLRLSIEAGLPNAGVDRLTAERLIGRLIAAVLSVGAKQEAISARLECKTDMLHFSIDRPRATLELDAEALFSSSADDSDLDNQGPALGLGFSLRLIASLARQSRGSFRIERQRFTLILPPAQVSAVETMESH